MTAKEWDEKCYKALLEEMNILDSSVGFSFSDDSEVLQLLGVAYGLAETSTVYIYGPRPQDTP